LLSFILSVYGRLIAVWDGYSSGYVVLRAHDLLTVGGLERVRMRAEIDAVTCRCR